MWELDHKESWASKNWCFWTVMLEKTLQSPLDCKEIQLVNPKDQSWIFIGRTDAEAKIPIVWSPVVKTQLFGKDPDARKDWGQGEKGRTEDEMVGWYHQVNWHDWANFSRLWRTGKPGGPHSMGSQIIRQDWVTEQQQHDYCSIHHSNCIYCFICNKISWNRLKSPLKQK